MDSVGASSGKGVGFRRLLLAKIYFGALFREGIKNTNCQSFEDDLKSSVFQTDVLQKNPEDVSNFDDEFTKEKPRFSSAKDKHIITEADQQLFTNFDFSLVC